MDPFQWMGWFLGLVTVPYVLIAAYRYMGRLYGGL